MLSSGGFMESISPLCYASMDKGGIGSMSLIQWVFTLCCPLSNIESRALDAKLWLRDMVGGAHFFLYVWTYLLVNFDFTLDLSIGEKQGLRIGGYSERRRLMVAYPVQCTSPTNFSHCCRFSFHSWFKFGCYLELLWGGFLLATQRKGGTSGGGSSLASSSTTTTP